MWRFTAAILLLFIQPLFGSGGRWINASTPHFELYTQLDERQAAQALQVFEQARGFFLQTNLGPSLADRSLRIIDLASETEYEPYLVKTGAHACYQRGRRGDYIVMRDLSPSHFRVAVHEYTHFVVEQAGLKLPIWLNEGLAEFYSTLEPRGNQYLIGRAQAGRLMVLETERRVPLETLFAVDGSSPYYNDPQKMQIFYAESWALTHMLASSPGYTEHFSAFVSAISSGHSASAAFQLAYGRDLRTVEADLDRYLRQKTLPAMLYDIKVELSNSPATIAPLLKAELDLSFADLLASNPYAASDVEARLSELARKHPDDPGFEELLGYLALREKRPELAQSHFSSAVDHQSKDPVAVYNSARLQQTSGAPASQIIPLLERALELNPDYVPARIDLGFTAAKANRFDLAVTTLSQLNPVDASLAFEVYFTIAYCDLHLNRLQDAASYASAAQQHARNSDQQNQASTLVRMIDGRQISAVR